MHLAPTYVKISLKEKIKYNYYNVHRKYKLCTKNTTKCNQP